MGSPCWSDSSWSYPRCATRAATTRRQSMSPRRSLPHLHTSSLSTTPLSREDCPKKTRSCSMTENAQEPIYEMSVNVLVAWQAHSLSTAGNNGSNRLLPRRQLLADKTETDAVSGNIAKHYHATLLAEYLEAAGCPLCPACQARDGRRAAA